MKFMGQNLSQFSQMKLKNHEKGAIVCYKHVSLNLNVVYKSECSCAYCG